VISQEPGLTVATLRRMKVWKKRYEKQKKVLETRVMKKTIPDQLKKFAYISLSMNV